MHRRRHQSPSSLQPLRLSHSTNPPRGAPLLDSVELLEQVQLPLELEVQRHVGHGQVRRVREVLSGEPRHVERNLRLALLGALPDEDG